MTGAEHALASFAEEDGTLADRALPQSGERGARFRVQGDVSASSGLGLGDGEVLAFNVDAGPVNPAVLFAASHPRVDGNDELFRVLWVIRRDDSHQSRLFVFQRLQVVGLREQRRELVQEAYSTIGFLPVL